MDKELVTCRKNLLVAKEKSQTFSNQLKSSRSQMQDAQSQKSRYTYTYTYDSDCNTTIHSIGLIIQWNLC